MLFHGINFLVQRGAHGHPIVLNELKKIVIVSVIAFGHLLSFEIKLWMSVSP